MKRNKITGIQIKGRLLISNNNIHYINNFEEMTIDTLKNNRIITSNDLLKIVERRK